MLFSLVKKKERNRGGKEKEEEGKKGERGNDCYYVLIALLS